jgi:hypothetical protein
MSRRRTRLVLLVAAGVMLALMVCAPLAQASGVLGSGIGPSIGPDLNPLPSVSELLKGVVNGLFGALLSALTPGFLKHADISSLQWLVALPDVANASVWPTVSRLQASMVWVAGALLPTTLIIATARDTALSLSLRANPGNALLRVLGAVFWLVLYRFGVENGVAFVNVLTHTMLSWSIVAEGLHRTVLVMFGGSLLVGSGGVFLAVLGLVALVFAICLFALKVLLLMVLAILFVSGPLFISLTPLPAVGYLARGWLLALTGVCLIPVGWCIIFATAGAISLDVTSLGGGAHIGSRVVGAFAALVTFYLAWKWPLMVLGHVRGSLGGLGVRPGGVSGGGSVQSNGALAAKAQRAKTGLQAAMLAGGRGLGLAAGQLGAPRGGLVGLAGRHARPPLAATAATGAIAVGPPRARPRPTAAGERVAQAGDKLRQTPGQMRDAWRASGNPTSSPASTRTGVPGTKDGRGTQDRSGVVATDAARPGRTRRQSTSGPGTSARKLSRAGASPRGPRKSASPPVPAKGVPGGSAGAAARKTSTSKRPPVIPSARSTPAGAPPAPGTSSRGVQAGGGGKASRQVSTPAQPKGGPTSRAAQARPSTSQRPRPTPPISRPPQGSPPTGQRPAPKPPDPRSARQLPAQHRQERPSRAPDQRIPPRAPKRKGGKA